MASSTSTSRECSPPIVAQHGPWRDADHFEIDFSRRLRESSRVRPDSSSIATFFGGHVETFRQLRRGVAALGVASGELAALVHALVTRPFVQQSLCSEVILDFRCVDPDERNRDDRVVQLPQPLLDVLVWPISTMAGISVFSRQGTHAVNGESAQRGSSL